MTTCTTARKPALRIAYSTATPNSVTISHSAAWIRFRVVTTSSAEARITPALMRKMISVAVMGLLLSGHRGLRRPIDPFTFALAEVAQDFRHDQANDRVGEQHACRVDEWVRRAQQCVHQGGH